MKLACMALVVTIVAATDNIRQGKKLGMRAAKTSLNKYANLMYTDDLFLDRSASGSLFSWLS